MTASIHTAQALYAAGWGFWLLLASLNNLVDPATNRKLLHRMLSMQELREDGVFGQGLLKRAIDRPDLCKWLLYGVVLAHVAVASLLLRAAWLTLDQTPDAFGAAVLAWSAFCIVWFSFLSGGLYFGYWLKMAPVQQVHFTLLMMGVLGLVLTSLGKLL
jgi:Predicted small integral membrane protein (DUF2165)